MTEQVTQNLAAFALELIDGAGEGGSFDGSDIQEAGVRHGLLVIEERQEKCGEHCGCAEHGFPIECYRLSPGLGALRHRHQAPAASKHCPNHPACGCKIQRGDDCIPF